MVPSKHVDIKQILFFYKCSTDFTVEHVNSILFLLFWQREKDQTPFFKYKVKSLPMNIQIGGTNISVSLSKKQTLHFSEMRLNMTLK